MYISYGDGDDCGIGHGTHCAGSIVGNSLDGSSELGVAKDAKIAVIDGQDSNVNCGLSINLPGGALIKIILSSNKLNLNIYIQIELDDYTNAWLLPMRDKAGAYIHSASWGANHFS